MFAFRWLTFVLVGASLLSVGPVRSSPVIGPYREQDLHDKRRARMEAHETYEFSDVFRVNQRACVMVEGDHKPVVDLTVRVFDAARKLVAQDTAGGDFVFVTWYPPRTEKYTIEISSNGDQYNELDIVLK
jgi:hypothetical protein